MGFSSALLLFVSLRLWLNYKLELSRWLILKHKYLNIYKKRNLVNTLIVCDMP